MQSQYLENETVLVTGGGGGIGWGICLECARAGARVVVTDVDDDKGNEVLEEVLKVSNGHIYRHLDLLRVESFGAVLSSIYDEVGPVSILVNNAGINSSHYLETMTEEVWDNVFGVNLKGHYFLTQLVSQNMIKQNIHGSIIWISSIHAKVPSTPHYTASKAGIEAILKQLAIELAPDGIRVNGIAPGGIYIGEHVRDRSQANDEPTVLLGGKNGIPSDIGRMVVVFAAKYWSRHITGQVIGVDGAQYSRPIKKA